MSIDEINATIDTMANTAKSQAPAEDHPEIDRVAALGKGLFTLLNRIAVALEAKAP